MAFIPAYENPKLRQTVLDACGRWHSILPALGISDSFITGKASPCPMCGGTDRFTFDNSGGYGTFLCRNCGAGDGIRLVQLALRTKTIFEAADEVAKHITGPVAKPRPRSNAQRLRSMRETWEGASRILSSSPAGQYLRRRCAAASYPPALRYHPRLGYYTPGQDATYHPALLAQVTDTNGRPVNIHRTYLTADGQKAKVPLVKRTMAGELPPGACIRLGQHGSTLGIAEGIETALSCAAMFGVPTWAAISAPGLERWIPPTDIIALVIFADADTNFAGQKAAFTLANRLALAHWPGSIAVRIPTVVPNDFNDEHQARLDISR